MIKMKITEPVIVLPCGFGAMDHWRHLPERVEKIMTTVNEVAATLITISNELAKARGEIIAKLDELTLALIDVKLPPEAETALSELIAQAQALDDIVPDVEPTE